MALPSPSKSTKSRNSIDESDSESRSSVKDTQEAGERELRETFSMFDKDGDGTITTNELGVVMRALGHNPTDAELEEMVNDMDTNGNGLIDFDEFVTMMKGKIRTFSEEDNLHEAFNVFDKDGNGRLSMTELQHVFLNLGEKLTDVEIRQMMASVNPHATEITFEEFRKMLEAM